MLELHREIRVSIIIPTLKLCNRYAYPQLDSPEAVDLIYGTALAETGLRTLLQEHGPALGYWQMEPEDHDDLWTNYIASKPGLQNLIATVCKINPHLIHQDEDIGKSNHPLVWNLRYACLMCRIHYYREKDAIPDTVEEQANMWVKDYNKGGKASVEHYLEAWKNG